MPGDLLLGIPFKASNNSLLVRSLLQTTSWLFATEGKVILVKCCDPAYQFDPFFQREIEVRENFIADLIILY